LNDGSQLWYADCKLAAQQLPQLQQLLHIPTALCMMDGNKAAGLTCQLCALCVISSAVSYLFCVPAEGPDAFSWSHVPSALPKLILQIIPNWISKRLLMMFINQVNQLRHSSLVWCIL
jgi:hypothetical protein